MIGDDRGEDPAISRRFAIYFAPPPGSALEAFGRRWLGRDHVTGESVAQPGVEGMSAADILRITESARRYGFHGTLKAPFALKEDTSPEALFAAAEGFASSRRPFEAPPLEISCLSRWVACTLAGPCPAIDALAADCVRAFEPFRAPLSPEDLARRRENGLTRRQEDQLQAFGYPYIFEDFHFHMTLAGPLDGEELERVRRLLTDLAADALKSPQGRATPLEVDAISIYQQTARDHPFRQTARFPFAR